MKVLVAGGGGYIGSPTVKELIRETSKSSFLHQDHHRNRLELVFKNMNLGET